MPFAQNQSGPNGSYESSAAPQAPSGQGELQRRDSKTEGFLKEVKGSMKHFVQKCKGKRSLSKEDTKPMPPAQPPVQPDIAPSPAPQPQPVQTQVLPPSAPPVQAPQPQPAETQALQQASSSSSPPPMQQPVTTGPAHCPPQPSLPQGQPSMPQLAPQGPEQLPAPHGIPASGNEFKYPHCRIDQSSPHYRSLSSRDVSPSQRDTGKAAWDCDPVSWRDYHESARSYHDTGRDRDRDAQGSLEERYRRFLARTGRSDSLNYQQEEYGGYPDEEYYPDMYRKHGNQDARTYSDMDYQGLPRPPVPPTRMPRPDPSSWNTPQPDNLYMPSGGMGYGGTGHMHNDAAFVPPGEPAYMPTAPGPYMPMPEVPSFAGDYTYVAPAPMPMGPNMYGGAPAPTLQHATFWGAANDALSQSYNRSMQPASNPMAAAWGPNDMSLMMPYNSTRPGYPDMVGSVPAYTVNADPYAASVQRRLSIPMVV